MAGRKRPNERINGDHAAAKAKMSCVRELSAKPSSAGNFDSQGEELTRSQLVIRELLSACRSTLKPNDSNGLKLLTKAGQWYNEANKSFVTSKGFIDRVLNTTDQVRLHPAKVWVWTKDLFQELRAYKVKPTVDKKEKETKTTKSEATTVTTDEVNEEPPADGSDAGVEQEQEAVDSDSAASTSKAKKPSSRQIARLEALLADHHKEIIRYENMELSLDDLENDDNAYMITERLKRRAARIFHRLCELKDRSNDTGGAREKKFKYSGSRYQKLNIHVEKFVNKHDFEERMPDYSDIKKIVNLCNNKYQYRLNKTRIAELSKEVFTEVGGMLSVIRKKDFEQDFGPSEASRALTSVVEDPATFSSSLKEKLKANKVLADKNMKLEFQKWTEEEAKELDKKTEQKEDDKIGSATDDDDDKDGGDEEDAEDSKSSSSDEVDAILAVKENQDKAEDVNDAAEKHEYKETSDGEGNDDETNTTVGSTDDEENVSEVGDLSGIDEKTDSESSDNENDPAESTIAISDGFNNDQMTEHDIPASNGDKLEVIEIDSNDQLAEDGIPPSEGDNPEVIEVDLNDQITEDDIIPTSEGGKPEVIEVDSNDQIAEDDIIPHLEVGTPEIIELDSDSD